MRQEEDADGGLQRELKGAWVSMVVGCVWEVETELWCVGLRFEVCGGAAQRTCDGQHEEEEVVTRADAGVEPGECGYCGVNN